MIKFIKILILSIAIVSCNERFYKANKGSSSKAENEEIKKSPSDTNDINTTGINTKVLYPTKNIICEDSLTEYSFECLGKKINIHIPCDYSRTSIFLYTEGEILTIHYQDSSTIRILCGYEAEITIKQELKNDLYSKKIIINDYQVTYEDVPKNRLKLFEKSFKLMKYDFTQK